MCDYRCPVCETGAGMLGRPQGLMSLEDFQLIIHKIHHHTASLLFYFMGEPFLNPAAYEMIRYAKRHNIYVTSCTNGQRLDPDKLIWSGIDEISFQIGGTSPETHGVYRVRGDLVAVLENARAAVAAKRRHGAKTKIGLGLIVMRHNEHQIEEFRQVVSDMGVDEALLIHPCVRDYQQGLLYLTANEKYWLYDKAAFEQEGALRLKAPRPNRCWWIWHSLVITWDGGVVPCCRDPMGKYVMGNILKEDLSQIWNNRRFRAFRRAVLTHQKAVDICQLCPGYDAPEIYYTTIF